MRRILRRHEVVPTGDSLASRSVVPDTWRLLGEDASEADPIVVPLAELRKDTGAWLARKGPLGVRLAPAESVESLADVLPHLALVAVEFPNVGDGRGFSYGRLLRDRLGFKGELRAVGGGVKQDKIFLLARCGFESFELPPTEIAEEAVAALKRYDVVYQPGEPIDGIGRQRFFA
jgi:phosphoadenosine phosphosulfate reductase